MKYYNMNLFLISLSPWPLFLSFSLMLMMFSMTNLFFYSLNFLFLSLILNLLIIFCWFKDLMIESTMKGNHNFYVMNMLINSMIMFILSEVLFFFSFFWSYFHYLFSPDISLGSIWPCEGIIPINFINLPLINSILLISSGCSISWSHYSILSNEMKNSFNSLMFTIFLGILFIFCQIFEYFYSTFSFNDSVYGSIFFISTGFHGFHVLIGSIFLISSLMRLKLNHFSKNHLLSLEFSIWYWHFVDVVWLYLFMMIYWLGS